MTSPSARIAAVAATLVLLATACGDSGSTTTAPAGTEAPTTTAAPPTTVAPTTTMAPTTTAAPTTTVAPTTTAAPTTTVADTTTTGAQLGGDAEAQALADAKAAAVLAAVPEGWSGALEPDPTGGEQDTDEVFGPCAGADAFDLTQLDAVSAAITEVAVAAPPGSGGGLFPDPEGSVEARVFADEAVAEEAFAVLETVLGTQEGRDCLADVVLEPLQAELPPDTEVSFSVEALDVAGADVGGRLSFELNIAGLPAAFVVDILAARDGACTVFATFLAFGMPVDAAVQAQLMSAATGAYAPRAARQ